MIDMSWMERSGLAGIAPKALAGERLSIGDGEKLFACPDPVAVGALAHQARLARHGLRATYVVNRHVNYTNVCVGTCLFCAFRRRQGMEGAFTLGLDEIVAKAAEAPGAREIHIVGGCHPKLGLSFFEEALKAVGEKMPEAVLKCFTAEEIDHIARLEGLGVTAVLTRLKAAGLAMLAGGGAEIFHPEVRSRICPDKIDGDRWLAVHKTAHGLGIRSNCTMLYGHVETPAQRLDHLDRLRRAQDETGGFICFIPLAFQPKNNKLGLAHGPTGITDMKTMAVSRLMLDNIPHLKAYWVMLGVKPAQAALLFGADDLDGTVVEEKIGRMAGADSGKTLTRAELVGLIREAGLKPVARDGFFQPAGEVAA